MLLESCLFVGTEGAKVLPQIFWRLDNKEEEEEQDGYGRQAQLTSISEVPNPNYY